MLLEDPRPHIVRAAGRNQAHPTHVQAWLSWDFPDDSVLIASLEAFPDGSASLSEGWPQFCVNSAFAVVVLGHLAAPAGFTEVLLGVFYAHLSADWLLDFLPSAPMAELQAVVATVRLSAPVALPMHIHSDCLYVVQGANGERQAHHHFGIMRDLRRDLEVRRLAAPCTATWIRGHAGIPANELADHLAKRSLAGYTTDGLWQIVGSALPPAAPPQPPDADSQRRFWQAVLALDSPMAPLTASLPDEPPLHITFATANVTTLHPQGPQPSTRRLALDAAAHKENLTMLGVQEARSANQVDTASLPHYSVWASGATPEGRAGVELWLLREQVDSSKVYVGHADHRRLLVRLLLLGRPLCVFVGHALSTDQGETACRQWWATTSQLIRDFSSDGVPWVLLLDANARVEGVTLEIGDHHPQDANLNGELLQHLASQLSVFAPATFEGYSHQSRDDAATWRTGVSGGRHRLDYVFVPPAVAPGSARHPHPAR